MRRCTDKKELDSARSCSDNVEVSVNGHVVIGVRIVQCHHAIMDVVIGVRVMHLPRNRVQFLIFHFWSQFQLVTCSQFQLVVRLYALIVTFPVAIVCTLLHRQNTSFEVWYLQDSSRAQLSVHGSRKFHPVRACGRRASLRG